MNFGDKLLRIIGAATLVLISLAVIEHLTYMRVAVVERHKRQGVQWREALAQVEARCEVTEAAAKRIDKKIDSVHDWRVRLTLEARQRGWTLTGLRYGPSRSVTADE